MARTSTINSTIKGKAYEYACVLAVKAQVELFRRVEVVENTTLQIVQKRYESDISESERLNMLTSASAGVRAIIEMEPRILEDGNDTLTLTLQPDEVAKTGDVRDILIIRRDIKWEIGVSVKHNHGALKHNRLSAHLDFGARWYGVPCSQTYFDTIRPIFERLERLKSTKAIWDELPDKRESVYMPLIDAFIAELSRANSQTNGGVVKNLVRYTIGSSGKDYYKLIHYNKGITRVIPYNFESTLNQPAKTQFPSKVIPKILLPTMIIGMKWKEDSQTTSILAMDNGWSISFRIHNAETRVVPTLKFDIQLIGQPCSLWFIDVAW